MKIIGFDPGFSGAWGMIEASGAYAGCGDTIHDSKRIYTRAMFEEISQIRDKDDLAVVIEAVHAMPKQGVSSTFKFGVSFGSVMALADRLNEDCHLVTPQRWKKDLGLSSDKNESLAVARELWPEAPLKRQKDNGRAEALLIAHWYRTQL